MMCLVLLGGLREATIFTPHTGSGLSTPSSLYSSPTHCPTASYPWDARDSLGEGTSMMEPEIVKHRGLSRVMER